ncbi:hypothetical protein Tcan_14405 [Toxocara canis]|uniref:Uncharacterized protein n=1 Tax=Toxocara canis TaxID=6265 RepID=A0A0B2VQL8_TOXCA|nr:hypothetical protein Tcan_14405 [Toxocara canis]
MYMFCSAWNGLRLGWPLSVVCFPSAALFPSFQRTSLAQFNDFNDMHLGCMECGVEGLRKAFEDDQCEAHFARNVFIPQGAQAHVDAVDIRRGTEDNGDVQTRLMAYRLRVMADNFELEFASAAALKSVNFEQKSIVEKLLDGVVDVAKAFFSLC